jgi:hypothetical protein
MIARRTVVIGLCIGAAFATLGAGAAEPSAKSFVEAIYAAYRGKDSKGISLESAAAVRRYFEPTLAALILKDRRDAHGEVGMLDSDPFIDGQDWEIDAVDIAMREIAADKASATVSFTNLGDPTTVVLDLVKLKQGWRIANITWEERKATLRGILTKK